MLYLNLVWSLTQSVNEAGEIYKYTVNYHEVPAFIYNIAAWWNNFERWNHPLLAWIIYAAVVVLAVLVMRYVVSELIIPEIDKLYKLHKSRKQIKLEVSDVVSKEES